MVGNLYKLDVHTSCKTALVEGSIETWHRRLAHIQPATIQEMAKLKAVKGLEIRNFDGIPKTCTRCVLGKAHGSAIPKASSSRSTQPFQLVHSDMNGPIKVPSLGESRYFVTFTEDITNCASLYTMKTKSERFKYFKIFIAHAEKQTGAILNSLKLIGRYSKSKDEVKALRIDNGGEYLSNGFNSFLQERGIQN